MLINRDFKKFTYTNFQSKQLVIRDLRNSDKTLRSVIMKHCQLKNKVMKLWSKNDLESRNLTF